MASPRYNPRYINCTRCGKPVDHIELSNHLDSHVEQAYSPGKHQNNVVKITAQFNKTGKHRK